SSSASGSGSRRRPTCPGGSATQRAAVSHARGRRRCGQAPAALAGLWLLLAGSRRLRTGAGPASVLGRRLLLRLWWRLRGLLLLRGRLLRLRLLGGLLRCLLLRRGRRRLLRLRLRLRRPGLARR